jgi:hypothetical protein
MEAEQVDLETREAVVYNAAGKIVDNISAKVN